MYRRADERRQCTAKLLPSINLMAAARRRHPRAVRHGHDLREQRQRLGRKLPEHAHRHRLEYLRRGHSEREATNVFFNNPCRFFAQSGKWKIKPVEA